MSSSEYSYDGESLPPSRETSYIVAKLTAEDIFNVVFGIFNQNTARKMSRLREELTCETVDAVIDSFREELSPTESPYLSHRSVVLKVMTADYHYKSPEPFHVEKLDRPNNRDQQNQQDQQTKLHRCMCRN
ncbi:hypothetical protein FQA47_016538 [Oryzias melastigma]|uniref:Uncharacterized protein n=1 Tax=Oryzias melastigma TaxID=30732 RepID=A0A834FNG4_ORYME|nr:hypothetical protein FQA47_016538 [Oryzias melastigma]